MSGIGSVSDMIFYHNTNAYPKATEKSNRPNSWPLVTFFMVCGPPPRMRTSNLLNLISIFIPLYDKINLAKGYTQIKDDPIIPVFAVVRRRLFRNRHGRVDKNYQKSETCITNKSIIHQDLSSAWKNHMLCQIHGLCQSF
jgi:hypothetical protein